MTAKSRRSGSEIVDGGDDLLPATPFGNGMDTGVLVRHAFEMGPPEAFIHQLNNMLKKKEVEIEDLCKTHYEEFIVAVDELRGILVDVEELKGRLLTDNLKLQEVASALLLELDDLLEYHSIMKNVSEAAKISGNCIHLLELCIRCNDHVSEHTFHRALATLDMIQSRLRNFSFPRLGLVIEKKIPIIKSYIESKVLTEFDDWLAYIRIAAIDIGKTAMGHAASTWHRDKQLLDLQKKAEEEGNDFGLADHAYALDVEEIHEEPVLKFDLAPLYRAYHIHTCLQIQDRFRDYYYSKRLLHLDSDLQSSSTQPFIEYHQTFLGQMLGYFVVEDRVRRTAGGLLLPKQVETMWKSAVSMITIVLKEQFLRMDSTSHITSVKDFITLMVVTLRLYGYDVNPLLDVLDYTRDRYHEILLEDYRQQIAAVIADDTFKPMIFSKDRDYNLNVKAFCLHNSDIMPDFPYTAPFSPMVPKICHIIRSFIKASVDYLSRGGNADAYDFMKRYLDKLLNDALNDAMLKTIHSGSMEVAQSMQIAANIDFIERSCDFFRRFADQQCGAILGRPFEKPPLKLTSDTVLKTSRDAAYITSVNLVNSELDGFMQFVENVDWTADEIPGKGDEKTGPLLICLDRIISICQDILPLDGLYRIGSGAFEHISKAIVGGFLSDDVKRFNANAVMGINNDLSVIESFADDKFCSTGLFESCQHQNSFKDCLVEARQLIDLLTSDQPEEFMNPATRENNYNTLDFKVVALICEKYRDSGDGIFGSLSSRNAKHGARKKSVDLLKRRLRDFN